MHKAYNIAIHEPWAITEAGLRQVLLIANRENLDVEAVEAQLGRKLANTQSVIERDGVAVLPVMGPLARRANLFSAISGATSIELLGRDFNAALRDSSIRAILLNIDSPGGEVNGTDEFAQMVYAARGQKPVYCYIGGMGCSAAYWIASACDQVVCADTAMIGSIGVIAAVPDPTVDSAGDITFVSSQSPRKNADPTTDEGKSDIQATIDSLAQVFVEAVARGRGVSADTVLASFGQGGVFVGAEAVKAGLADKLGTFEDTIAQLSGRPRGASVTRMAAMDTVGVEAYRLASEQARTTGAALVAARAELNLSSGNPVARPPRVDMHPDIPKETRMSEDIQETAAPAPQAPAASFTLPPQIAASDPAVQAQVTELMAQMRADAAATRALALEEARAQFAREMAEERARTAISSYAQHVTTPTMSRPYALPIDAAAISAALHSLSAAQRSTIQGLFDRILDAGLVSFDEIGSQGEGAPEQSARAQFEAAVQAKVDAGLTKFAAMQAVGKADPELYSAYQAESSRRGAVQIKKGAK